MINVIPLTKRCSGKIGCGKELPISEFNKHPSGRWQSSCRKCHAAYARQQRLKSKTNQHELNFVQECIRRGIFAVEGVKIQGRKGYAWSDVVCWGLVRVEVKHAEPLDYGHNFRLSARQTKKGFDADLVCLVVEDDYHFISPDHSIFFRYDGTRKSAVSWRPGGVLTGRSVRFGMPLTDAIMSEHRNNWSIIDKVRLRKMARLQNELLQEEALQRAA